MASSQWLEEQRARVDKRRQGQLTRWLRCETRGDAEPQPPAFADAPLDDPALEARVSAMRGFVPQLSPN